MSERQPTESDRLLPLAVSSNEVVDRNDAFEKKDGARRRRKWWPASSSDVIGGATILAFVVVAGIVASSSFHDGGGGDHYGDRDAPERQRNKLQLSTEHALMSILPNDTLARIYRQSGSSSSSSSSSHPMGKLREVVSSKSGHDHHHDDGVFRCTSQIMIMRHCDKEVEVDMHGRHYTTDVMDKGGNGHCSATGVARSEYIATLFVDPNEYQKLVRGEGKGKKKKKKKDEDDDDDDGRVPPVPMIKSSLNRVSKVASSRKPQFPTPLKLYALAAERDGARLGHKGHLNFREIETITPLSKKFRMDVDDRFGVGDEGDLATDYFGRLTDSVVEKYRRRMMEGEGKGKSKDKNGGGGGGGGGGEALCDRGMTVVNWKHSRIPELARALGCGKGQGCPKKYDGEDFDTMWLLTFQYTAMLGSKSGHQARERMDELESDTLSALFGTKSMSGPTRPGGRVLRGGGDDGVIGTWKIKAEMVNEGFYPV